MAAPTLPADVFTKALRRAKRIESFIDIDVKSSVTQNAAPAVRMRLIDSVTKYQPTDNE
jgi:hypothetical protein